MMQARKLSKYGGLELEGTPIPDVLERLCKFARSQYDTVFEHPSHRNRRESSTRRCRPRRHARQPDRHILPESQQNQ